MLLWGRCPICQQHLAAVQEGVIVARPLDVVYAPEAEIRAYRVGRFQGLHFQAGPFPGGPGVWELEWQPPAQPAEPLFETPPKRPRR